MTDVLRRILAPCLLLVACERPAFDTATPEATLDAVVSMVQQRQAAQLPQLIEIEARDITFPDGVTEASAIGEVKAKAGDMLDRLLRVAAGLRDRFPQAVAKEVRAATSRRNRGIRDNTLAILADPGAWLASQRPRLAATDLGDGTAALTWDDEPVLAGVLTLVETGDGWRFRVPVELVRENPYWPDTREEWSVITSMMLAVENALMDFERDLDGGKIASLDAASARVGRLVGESVVVQSVIYAAMKRPESAGTPDPSGTGGASAP
jgi:hypothetical protein